MPAVDEWIEDPDLYLRMGREDQDLLISGGGLPIINQDTRMEAAIGCGQQGVGSQETGRVRGENVVLNIERPLRGLDHLHPRRKTVRTHRQNAKCGLVRMSARLVFENLSDSRLFRVRKR